MVKIRLTRAGAKKRPFYRVIAIDHREKRDGRALQFLGTYNPMTEPVQIKLDHEGIAAWVGKGAQLAPSVKGLIKRQRKLAPEPVATAPVATGTAAAEGAAS
ncbi:MAG: 30S ribosomal protein S16 [Deltaproteobacteria bacterium]|nr:30S ribosomal protein S16 [Deltaproteobacteria bacterium]MBW2396925.1 30S ribosomal protein S16 [Deltaproteobacteria bacterium]